LNLSLLRSDADRTGDVDHADALSVLGCGRQPTVSPLQNCVAQVVRKYLDDLENHACGGLFDAVLAEVEKPMLSEVLRHCDGKQIRAAELLGINRATLRKKLREYGLN
jgi:Fis family transcriptional regulator, factor for inversion stimulation protein